MLTRQGRHRLGELVEGLPPHGQHPASERFHQLGSAQGSRKEASVVQQPGTGCSPSDQGFDRGTVPWRKSAFGWNAVHSSRCNRPPSSAIRVRVRRVVALMLLAVMNSPPPLALGERTWHVCAREQSVRHRLPSPGAIANPTLASTTSGNAPRVRGSARHARSRRQYLDVRRGVPSGQDHTEARPPPRRATRSPSRTAPTAGRPARRQLVGLFVAERVVDILEPVEAILPARLLAAGVCVPYDDLANYETSSPYSARCLAVMQPHREGHFTHKKPPWTE